MINVFFTSAVFWEVGTGCVLEQSERPGVRGLAVLWAPLCAGARVLSPGGSEKSGAVAVFECGESGWGTGHGTCSQLSSSSAGF